MKNRANDIATSGISRREFLHSTASISFVVGTGGAIAACSSGAGPEAESTVADKTVTPNIWVTIGANNQIVIKYAGTEMGQGSMTHVPLILAEHMDADWADVSVETVAVNDKSYGNPIFQNNLYTAGSTHVMVYFDKLAHAGTQARKWLMSAVAEHWQVPMTELSTKPQVVAHAASGKEISFGDIVASIELPTEIPEVDKSEFKAKSDYRYLGKSIMRRDVPAKSNGSQLYGMDVQVPGMAFAAIHRCPVEGDGPAIVDDVAARAVPGIIDIVTLPYGVAIVGETVEATKVAKSKLQVTWTEKSPFRKKNLDTSLREYQSAAHDLDLAGVAWGRPSGDAKAHLSSADRVVEATYSSDPAYHAQMEPLNATASVSDDGKSAEIWVGTQTQSLTIMGAAEALETEEANITLHPLSMGGGFGRRSVLRQQYVDDALFTSRALKRPIKVIWSREDDLLAGQFRGPAVQYLRGAFGADGKLTAVHHRVATPYNLPTMNKHRWEASKPKDVISMLGSENSTYDIAHHLAEHIPTDRPCRVIAYRGVATSYTKFAIESFVDELAHDRGINPLEMRLQLCHKNPRMTKVLERVAELADWGRKMPADRALGLAISGYSRSLSAGIAEIAVDSSNGRISVLRYFGVGDAGFIVSPKNAQAQLLGNIIFGLSSGLHERVTIKDGIVQQSNFHDYRIMRMNEVPDIQAEVLTNDAPPTGVGELGMAMVAPSIANALFTITGKRVRHMPLAPDVVLRALNT